MEYNEIEKSLLFGKDLVDLRLQLIPSEIKRKKYAYPEGLMRNSLTKFSKLYKISLNSFPKRLKSADIPNTFVNILGAQHLMEAYLVSLGYNVEMWFRNKFHGGEILTELNKNLRDSITDFNHKVSGIKEVINKIWINFEMVDYNSNDAENLFELLTHNIEEYFQSKDPQSIIEIPEIHYELKESIVIFVSYSMEDTESFKIEEIADRLEHYYDIERVLYCEGESYDDFIQYMNDNIGKSDLLLLFCSPNSLRSKYVEKEWRAAEANDILILPIFTRKEYIPPFLKSRLGVEFDQFQDIQIIVKQIHNTILRKAGKKIIKLKHQNSDL